MSVAKQEGALPEVNELIKATRFPTFTTAMGKGGPDETSPYFKGVYAGIGTVPDVKEAIESADLLLWVGRFAVGYINQSKGHD